METFLTSSLCLDLCRDLCLGLSTLGSDLGLLAGSNLAGDRCRRGEVALLERGKSLTAGFADSSHLLSEVGRAVSLTRGMSFSAIAVACRFETSLTLFSGAARSRLLAAPRTFPIAARLEGDLCLDTCLDDCSRE